MKNPFAKIYKILAQYYQLCQVQNLYFYIKRLNKEYWVRIKRLW